MERDAAPVIKAIPPSNDTVARRIREISLDTEAELCATLRGCPFSIQLDETTTADNNTLLMGYVRLHTNKITYCTDIQVLDELTDGHLLVYRDHLMAVKADMELWERVHLLLLAFPTSYLVEQGFSQALHMQSKYRNRLDLVSSGALRLKLTSQCPDVKALAAGHQAQGSH
ncbi:unnamed protein product [Arctogadus glacialis]